MVRTIRRRYVAAKVESLKTFCGKDVYDALWTNLVWLFGEYGASQAELYLVEYDAEKSQVILRFSHKALEMVKASITATTEVANEKAALRMFRVSGTLRSLRTKIPNQLKWSRSKLKSKYTKYHNT